MSRLPPGTAAESHRTAPEAVVAGRSGIVFVGEIMQATPVCVDAEDSVVDLAAVMGEHGLDQLPVCRDGAFVAMVGQGDIVRECVAAGLDPRRTTVGALVRPDPGAVQASTTAEEALLSVLHTGRRCLAVLQGTRLVGIVSQADLVDALPDETVSGILAVVSG